MKLRVLFALILIVNCTVATAAAVRSDQIVSVENWTKKEKKWGDTTNAVTSADISQQSKKARASQSGGSDKQAIPAADKNKAEEASSRVNIPRKSV